MTTVNATTVERYIEMWNETDPDRRRELVATTVSDDAEYLDPIMSGTGVDAITAMIGAAQEQYPGHRFALASAPDAHHDRVRFSWSLAAPSGDRIALGHDFATVADDGRLRTITGFLEHVS